MDTTTIYVNDKIITTSQTVTSIDIELVSLNLGVGARFVVRQFNDNKNLVDLTFVNLEGDDYKAWGTDDNYIENFILNTLGMTKKD